MSHEPVLRCEIIKKKFDQQRAFKAQTLLSRKVILKDDFQAIQVVAGTDLSYLRIQGKELGIAILVFLRYPSLKPWGCIYGVSEVCVPYIPGLLAFREMPPFAVALAMAKREGMNYDLLFVDGHGRAHPRRLGIASHIGVVTGQPSIGVAKRKLVGIEKDNMVIHNNEIIAKVLTRGKYKVYVSVGHRISLETAAKVVSKVWRKGRLPEPTRIADRISKHIKPMIMEMAGETEYLSGRCSSFLPTI
ncbi:MAG: endonuclease V [Desulfurococcales archaeon]|nr:endonuclease V [Desulfurococcales archaeon]